MKKTILEILNLFLIFVRHLFVNTEEFWDLVYRHLTVNPKEGLGYIQILIERG